MERILSNTSYSVRAIQYQIISAKDFTAVSATDGAVITLILFSDFLRFLLSAARLKSCSKHGLRRILKDSDDSCERKRQAPRIRTENAANSRLSIRFSRQAKSGKNFEFTLPQE